MTRGTNETEDDDYEADRQYRRGTSHALTADGPWMTQLTVWGPWTHRYRYRATMEGGHTAVSWWNAQIVLHAGTQTRGLASRANRKGRWGDDLPI